ncbi:MAG TPA: hypothetical protein PKG58_04145 [Bacillota bacterium]|jgi:Glu-tRNA(Gln) amidotransferase subunit E-like FAD-binding protein|nr:hypothetical protein [Bacillota bacterium]
MANIKINLNGLEIMVFFWNSLMSREKVSESFLNDLCSMQEFSYIYNEDFNNESLRRVLSALNNKEPFSGNKPERKYYSNSLMIMEYIDEVQPAINAIKKLNLNSIAEKAKEDVEVVVVPGLSKGIEKTDNKLIVDFFGLKNTENGLVISGESLEAVLKNIFEV